MCYHNSMIKPPFVNDGIYHIYNRGVEKRDVFLGDADHLRFIHDVYEFNDEEAVAASNIRLSLRKPSLITPQALDPQCLEVKPPNIEVSRKKRQLLVRILAFCLMPNHYHLLLQQIAEKGIVRFMHKLGTGYTMYFNQKNNRVGALFQGAFKAKEVKNDGHLWILPSYIHLNPLDLFAPEWRERSIDNASKAMDFLENYRWSSFSDYIGKKNFPSVTQRDFLEDIVGDPEKYRSSIHEWLQEMDKENIRGFFP